MADRMSKGPLATFPRGARRLGVLPLIYLDGRVLHGGINHLLRRETGDSNPGHPRLKGVAGFEPTGLADPDAYRNYRALFASSVYS